MNSFFSFFLFFFFFCSLQGIYAQIIPTNITWSTIDIQWNSYQVSDITNELTFLGIYLPACTSTPLSSPTPLVYGPLTLAFGGLRLWNNHVGVTNGLLYSETNGLNSSGDSNIIVSSPSPSDPQSEIDAYYGGGMALLQNGNLMIFGGLDGSFNPSNDITWSQDFGITYFGFIDSFFWQYQSKAPWSPRYSFGYCTIPNSNIVIMTGGRGIDDSSITNDIWMNQDGATSQSDFQVPGWTLVPTAGEGGPLPTFSEGVTLTALYNSLIVLAGGTSPGISRGTTNDVYVSGDFGMNWISYTYRAWEGRFGHSTVADTDNLLYLTGGWSNGYIQSDLWVSKDFGMNWEFIPVINPLRDQITASCIGIYYSIDDNNILTKSLYSWGGRGFSGTYFGIYIGTLGSSDPIYIDPSPSPSFSPIVYSGGNFSLVQDLTINSTIKSHPFGGDNETIIIDFWIFLNHNISKGVCSNLTHSIWLLWIQNGTDSIQIILQLDGTISFGITNGKSGFYSLTTASYVLNPHQWQHIIFKSIPLPKTNQLALHTIQINNTIVATNNNGRYPEKIIRKIAWFGNGPFPTTITPFHGHVNDFFIISS